jgi:hypothetical protein
MISIMECVVSLFENVVAENAKIWMSLRELRPDGFYHTFARAGRFTPPREHSSLPLHRSRSATIRRLRDSIDCQQCVLLTGSTRGPEMWTPQPNDSFGEDKCVLMGAVLIKAWDAPDSFKRPKLVWILTVCADRENAFDASHVPLMQSCVDVFSMIVNVMARHPKCITTHSVGAASSGVIHNTSIDVGTSGSPSSPVVHSTSSFNI